MERRFLRTATAVMLSAALLFSPLRADAQASIDQNLVKTDFYEAVNGQTIRRMVIGENDVSVDYFTAAQDNVDEKLEFFIKNIAQNLDLYEKDSAEYQLGALYQCAMDTDTRDAYGYGATGRKFLEDVEQAQNVGQLLQVTMEFERKYGESTLLKVVCVRDLKDAEHNILQVDGAAVPLLKELWYGEDAYSASVRQSYQQYLTTLGQIGGKTKKQAQESAGQLCDIYTVLSAAKYDSEEYYDPEMLYHVYRVSDLTTLFSVNFPMEEFCRIYGVEPDDRMNVAMPEYINLLGSLLTEENLPLMKEFVKMNFIRDMALIGDTKSLEAYKTLTRQIHGQEEKQTPEEDAVNLVETMLADLCSRVYVENFFDEESKLLAEAMSREFLSVYRYRLICNEWLEEATKRAAIKKIDTMTVKVGYPSEWPDYMEHIRLSAPAEGGNLVDNILSLKGFFYQQMLSAKEELVDKEKWTDTTTFAVNAFYETSENAIYIPAAILQAPFFDKNASTEENLGGIGTIIGHEITHAFDSEGSRYDEKGNYENWWTKSDLIQFAKRAFEVMDYYDSYEYAGMQVDGGRTLSENIADLGSLAVVTQIAKEKGLDLSKVYAQYAAISASRLTPEYEKVLMETDVHAPDKVRVNAVLSSMPEFYELFGVQAGDGMYRSEEERVRVW